MTDHPLVHKQTPVEYFKDLVESSLSRQHVRAGDLTEVYLVNLLCQYVRVEASPHAVDDGQPLGLQLVRALESPRPRPRYFVTKPTHAADLLRRLLPTRVLDAVVRGR